MLSRWMWAVLGAAVGYAAASGLVLGWAMPAFTGQAVIARIVPIAVLILGVGLGVMFSPHAGFNLWDVMTLGIWQGVAERRYLRAFAAALLAQERAEAAAGFFAPIAAREPELLWDDKPISLSEAYDRARRPMVLAADGGAGKTRALRWLARRLAGAAKHELSGEQFRLPVFMDVGVVQSRERGREASIMPYVEECLAGASRRLASRTRAYMEQGALALLVDNMDEAEPRGAVTDALKRLSNVFPEVKIVIACRRSALPAIADFVGGDAVNVAELRPLESEDIESLLGAHFEEEQAAALWERITSRGLVDIARNPLALWRMACLWGWQGEGAEISDNRGQMMSGYVQCLTQSLPEEERSAVGGREGQGTLAAWAFERTRAHQTAQEREEAVLELAGALGGDSQRARELLRAGVASGMLTEPGAGLVAPRRHVRFSRREFQDFFAARRLMGRAEGAELSALVRDAEWWWEPLVLVTGLLRPEERLEWMSRLLSATEDPVLVVACVVGGQIRDVRLQTQALTTLREALQRGLTAAQEQSLVALGRGGAARAIEFIAQLLDESDVELRWAAVRFLRRAGGTYVAGHLVERGLNDRSGAIRWYVARGLSEVSWSEANLDYLARAAQSDVFSQRAVDIMLSIGGGRAAEAAIHHLAEGRDHRVRRTCAVVLGRMRWREAVDPLVAALKDRDPSVRTEAARALGILRERRGVEPLAVALGDPCPRVRWMALRALAAIGHRWPVSRVMTCLRDSNLKIREEAAVTLQRLARKRGEPERERPSVRAH